VHETALVLRTGQRPAPPTLPAALPAPDGPGPLASRLLTLAWIPIVISANLLRWPAGHWGLTLAYNLALLLFVALRWNGYRPEQGDNYTFGIPPRLDNARGQSPPGDELAG
jgi:hypothetical protein